jgi:hypothetical protein
MRRYGVAFAPRMRGYSESISRVGGAAGILQKRPKNERKLNMKSRKIIFTTVLSALACFAFLQETQAAPAKLPAAPKPTIPEKVPSIPMAPDAALAGFNTADGDHALFSITTGAANSAFGWRSLFSNTDASFNTGVGALSLLFNDGSDNTAVGAAALLFNTTANDNTAVGAAALENNKTAGDNNAVGAFALNNNDSDGAGNASFNNAHGRDALLANVDGTENEAFGDLALESNLASHNTAMGDDALDFNTTGDSNTAVGREAGDTCVDGSHNVFIGDFAGAGTIHSSNIIAIGAVSAGPFADNGPTCFIGGINEPTGDPGSTVAVLIDSNNNLGTTLSSRRFKHDIKPIDKASEALLALKPVSFKYNYDRKGSTQYGLIAEEVAQVNPHLVVYRDDEPYTVKYDQINVMLLNEFLREHKRVEEQQASISQLKSEVQTMVAQLKEQAAQIQKVSAQIEVNKPAAKVVVNKP